ncbi:Protein inturned, partial [Geodia barretti]
PSSLPLSLLSPSLPPRSISPSSFRLSLLVFRGSVKSQIPLVASLDRVLTAHLSSPRHSSHLPHTPRSSKRRSLDKHNHTKQGSDSEGEEDSGLAPRSMTFPSFRPRGKKRSSPLPSLPETLALRQNYTLTAGNENILLHYLSLEAGQGAWLGPTHHTSSTYGTLHLEMVTCFHTTCSSIREMLLAKTDEDLEDDVDWEDESEEEEEDMAIERQATPPTFSCPPLTGGRCVEHGVLLEVPLRNFATNKQLRNIPPLCYWVVG